MRTALVIGATGLIGRHLVFELIKNPAYSKVVVLVRKDMVLYHQKLEQHIVDFEQLDQAKACMAVDDVFCCLGTTSRKTPDKTLYRKIDYEYPLKVGQLALEMGATQYVLVSSMGASANSSFFYTRLKAETEGAISQLAYQRIQIVRPSMLLGSRSESRPMEAIMQTIFQSLGVLFVGPLKKYKAIQGATVANAMVQIALANHTGMHIWMNNQLFEEALKDQSAT